MKNKISQRWYYVYFVLAAFDVVTVICSLLLSHQITNIYQQSVYENALWADRLSHYSKLGLLAGAVNAPGNDVFDTKDPFQERRNLKSAHLSFLEELQLAEEELKRIDSLESREQISTSLSVLKNRMDKMVSEADHIFSLFENNLPNEAAAHMATMDRKFAEVNEQLFLLRGVVSSIQRKILSNQAAKALELRKLEYIIAGAILMMVSAILLYGRFIGKKMRLQQEERELLLGEILNQRRALDEHSIVAVTDTKGTILQVNDLFCKISGYSKAELLGENHRLISSGYHPKEFWKEMYRTIGRGGIWHGEIQNKAKDGTLYWVDSTIYPVRNEQGKIKQYIALRSDITARKNAENVLIAAREEALKANRIKSEFLANMSHEIRTPMNGILGMTNLALAESLSDTVRDYLQTAKISGEALLTIINDILDFSKIEAGKLSISPVPIKIHEIIERIIAVLENRVSEKDICLVTDISESVPKIIVCDEVRLGQIITNLVGNAIKFTPKCGGITLQVALESCSDEIATLRFTVTDSGVGIPEESLSVIFEAFSQADGSTTRKFGGTGLGLSISKSLVEAMGGTIGVESRKGVGSRFYFTIKAQVLDEKSFLDHSAKISKEVNSNLIAESQNNTNPLRVLLVEDNLVNQKLAYKLLERSSCKVTVAQNGQEAVEILCNSNGHEQFDIVLMDCQMPVMGGFEATESVRNFESSSGLTRVPIIALTANAMEGDRDKCLNAGMDDYISKPIDVTKLRSTIERFRPTDT